MNITTILFKVVLFLYILLSFPFIAITGLWCSSFSFIRRRSSLFLESLKHRPPALKGPFRRIEIAAKSAITSNNQPRMLPSYGSVPLPCSCHLHDRSSRAVSRIEPACRRTCRIIRNNHLFMPCNSLPPFVLDRLYSWNHWNIGHLYQRPVSAHRNRCQVSDHAYQPTPYVAIIRVRTAAM